MSVGALTDSGLRVLGPNNELSAKLTADGVRVHSEAGKVRFKAP